jgi:CheY-like chemotaxis protein
VTNLVGNAIKFTSGGHVLVSVSCDRDAADHAQVRVSVTDTGIGIPEEKIGILFEQFSQVDGSTTRSYGGTGLGLAISKQLVNLMGGAIGVKSRSAAGSTFWFTLPLRPDPLPNATAVSLGELHGTRVLIAVDHEVNRHLLHHQIVDWGLRGECGNSAVDSIRALRAARVEGDPYQIAIIDCQMSGGGGDVLAAAIKDDPAIRDTVVVLLTAISQSSSHSSARSDGCLVKPVRQAELLQTIAASWAKRRGLENPIAVSLVDAPAHRALVEPVSMGLPAGHTIRVLIAEDNPVNQKVAVRMLEKLGLRADVASSGQEAVQLFEMRPYNLILMDCQMPDMDGYEASRQIRRMESSGRHSFIVAMTADAMA